MSWFRSGVTQVHRWTGLTIGLLAIFLAVTGGWIVLRPILDPVTYPQLMVIPACTKPLPVDSLAAAARTLHPKGRLDYVWFYDSSTSSTMVRFSDGDQVYVDTCSGRVLGHQARYGGLYGTVEALHRFKFMDIKPGMLIIGWTSLLLAVLLVLGGLFLWWPRRASAWKSAVKLNRRLNGRAFSLNLHTTTGVYASVVVFVVALTAVPLSLGWAKSALYVMTGSAELTNTRERVAALPKKKHAPKHGKSASAKRIPMQVAWAEARGLVPGALRWASIRYPLKNQPIEIALSEQRFPHSDARSYVYVDSRTAKVLDFRAYETRSAGEKLYLWMLALHTGHFGGVFVQVLMLLGMIAVPVMGYTGIESFVRKTFRRPRRSQAPSALRVRIAAIREEAEGIRSFELVSADGAPLPAVSAGAHVDVRLRDGRVRQYSLTNGPEDTAAYHISVRLAPDSRGGSIAMHDLREGEVLTISAPRNHFPVNAEAAHHLLLGGGIGITPLYAMVRQLAASGGSFELHYFTRTPAATAFHEALSAAEYAGKVHFHYALEPQNVRAFLADLLRERRDAGHLYVCGPAPFMALVHETAEPVWPPDTVHCEYFAADPVADSGPREAFEVTFARSGGTFDVPADMSILQILTRCGVDVPTSCEQGVCGTCLTRVLEGEPDHRDVFLTGAERHGGEKMLVCVSRAKSSHLVLDI
jgi:ferredoxin-NADP reductase